MTKKINLDELQKMIVTRPVRSADIPKLIELEKKCFPGMKTWQPEQIESQRKHFPEGQMCIEYNGKIIGSSACLIIDFDEYTDGHSYMEICGDGYLTNHDPGGDTLYGIEVMVDPKYRGMKIGRRLYEERKKLATRLNLKRIVIGGRVPDFHKHADKMDIHAYVQAVMEKRFYDPVLTFQLANGFSLKRIITNYLSADEESQGYALLLEWVNLHYAPQPAERTRSTFPVRICTVQYQMRKIDSFEQFAQNCEFFVDVASGYKSDFVVFPEIFTLQMLSFLPQERPGVSVRKLSHFTSDYIELFQGLAMKYAVNIIGGSHYTEEGDQIYNISYLFKRDGGLEKQYKLHITPNEQKWWGVAPGRELKIFDTDRGKISIQICYDVEFPELGRLAVQKGANMIFVPFCTDNRQGYLRVRLCAQARAIENQMYVITSGCVGNIPSVENMDVHYAQSGIFTPSDFPFPPDGVAGECQANIETVVVADVDLELIRQNRIGGTVRTLMDRRTDLYEIRNLSEQQESHQKPFAPVSGMRQ